MDFISELFRYPEKVDNLFVWTIIESVVFVFALRALNAWNLRFSPVNTKRLDHYRPAF